MVICDDLFIGLIFRIPEKRVKQSGIKKESLIRVLLVNRPEIVLEELFGIPSQQTPGFEQAQTPMISTIEDIIHFTGLKEEKVLNRLERYLVLEKDIEVSCRELSENLVCGNEYILLDVREQWEFDTAKIEGSLRLGDLEFEDWFLSVKKSGQEVVTICHHGIRSFKAAIYLRQQGLDSVKSLKGGLDQWSVEIDPAIVRY